MTMIIIIIAHNMYTDNNIDNHSVFIDQILNIL